MVLPHILWLHTSSRLLICVVSELKRVSLEQEEKGQFNFSFSYTEGRREKKVGWPDTLTTKDLGMFLSKKKKNSFFHSNYEAEVYCVIKSSVREWDKCVVTVVTLISHSFSISS